MVIAGKVTRKGQVTIPAEMREALGIEEGDRVVFRLQDDVVTIAPAGSLVSKLAIGGGLDGGRPMTIDEMRSAAEEGFAADEEALMEELGIEPPVR